MEQQTDIRNLTLADMVERLRTQQALVHDIVAPISTVTYDADAEGGQDSVVLHSYDHELSEEGVTQRDHSERFTVLDTAEQQIRDRIGMPAVYWRKLVGEHSVLRDQNVNHWFSGSDSKVLLRTLRDPDGGQSVLRAMLSDRYLRVDNLDVVTATLKGVRDAGVVDPSKLHITCDASLRKFVMRISAPEIAVKATELVERYRDPRSGRTGFQYPMVNAGVKLGNSEIGHGSVFTVPEVKFQVCSNGMTRTQDLARSVHLGERMDEGVVSWSMETQQKQIELLALKTADAVATFLSTEYVESVVEELLGYTQRIDDPKAAVEHVATVHRFTEQQQDDVLAAFLGGGDLSPLGVAQAVTNIAQDASTDAALELEAQAWKVMETAAAAC